MSATRRHKHALRYDSRSLAETKPESCNQTWSPKHADTLICFGTLPCPSRPFGFVSKIRDLPPNTWLSMCPLAFPRTPNPKTRNGRLAPNAGKRARARLKLGEVIFGLLHLSVGVLHPLLRLANVAKRTPPGVRADKAKTWWFWCLDRSDVLVRAWNCELFRMCLWSLYFGQEP